MCTNVERFRSLFLAFSPARETETDGAPEGRAGPAQLATSEPTVDRSSPAYVRPRRFSCCWHARGAHQLEAAMRALHDVVVCRVLCVVILLLPWVTGGIRTSVGGASLASDKKDDGSPGARDPRWWWSTALAAPRISPDVGAITRHVCGPRMDASCVRPACCIHNPTRVCAVSYTHLTLPTIYSV